MGARNQEKKAKSSFFLLLATPHSSLLLAGLEYNTFGARSVEPALLQLAARSIPRGVPLVESADERHKRKNEDGPGVRAREGAEPRDQIST